MVLQLKKIKFEDTRILFKWANLKSVRKNSLTKKKNNLQPSSYLDKEIFRKQ